MKKTYPFILLLLANIAPLCLCLFYRFGGMMVLYVFPPIHIILFLLNNALSESWPQIIIASVLHMLISLCTIMQIGWLYLHYICYDGIGVAVVHLECSIALVITLVLGLISLVMFYRKGKKNAIV